MPADAFAAARRRRRAARAGNGPTYPLQAGIPQFLRFGSAESDEGRTKLARLNEMARRDGWEAALRSVYRDEPGMVDYVTQTARASFIDLLPITPATDVLEIGPGLGQFTPLFARRARRSRSRSCSARPSSWPSAARSRGWPTCASRPAATTAGCRIPTPASTWWC